MTPAVAQETTPQLGAQVEGIVRDSAGKPVEGVSVSLQPVSVQGEEHLNSLETKTNAGGAFRYSQVRPGDYTLKVEKSGFFSPTEDSVTLSPSEKKRCDFTLRASWTSSIASSAEAIQLDDRPNFIVSGVTDSTGSGGHASETRVRTGEVLAKETVGLEAVPREAARSAPTGSEKQTEGELRAALLHSPQSVETNHALGEFYFRVGRCREAIPPLATAYRTNPGDFRNALDLALAYKACGELTQGREHMNQMRTHEKDLSKQNQADLHRLLGDFDEKLEDPLDAVREYQHAAALNPSEQNYFAWGAELLLHKAAAPAVEVFGKGVRLHPDSSRMLAGLGAALYASGSVDDAAQRLCQAADLEPANSAPYLFLGKIQEAASAPLPCAEERLARFAQEQPQNALANYYYGLALWKRDRGSKTSETLERAEALLEKASAIDPKLDAPYLQLGNIRFSCEALQQAVTAYQKAIAANPAGSEAHYRLGLAYKRLGDEAKAQEEIEQYKQLDKNEAAAIERQRREIRQFLFVLTDQPTASGPTSAVHFSRRSRRA
jgi:tetratricopeptide (TPR) repeat protein